MDTEQFVDSLKAQRDQIKIDIENSTARLNKFNDLIVLLETDSDLVQAVALIKDLNLL